MNEIIQEATNRLKKIFPHPTDTIEFIDEREDGRHFLLKVRSNAFNGRTQIERQRMIYDELEDLIRKDHIHALRMDLQPIEEIGSTTTSTTSQKEQDPDHYLYKLINSAPIMVFMKGDPYLPQCGFSAKIVELLDHIGVEFDFFDILEDDQVRHELKEYSNWPTYPQLYVNGELIGGLDISMELHEKGELKKILEKAKKNL